MSARGPFPGGKAAASGTDGGVSGQLAVCNGDFEFSSPREFALAAGRIGRVPLAPQYGRVYRVVRLWSAPGAAARLYAALDEEPSGLGYRADWFWFFFGSAEIAKLDAIAHRPAPDAVAKTSLLALALAEDGERTAEGGRR